MVLLFKVPQEGGTGSAENLDVIEIEFFKTCCFWDAVFWSVPKVPSRTMLQISLNAPLVSCSRPVRLQLSHTRPKTTNKEGAKES